jgi:hypothetical protein
MNTIYALVLAVALSDGSVVVERVTPEQLSLEKCITVSEIFETKLREEGISRDIIGYTPYCVPVHIRFGETI